MEESCGSSGGGCKRLHTPDGTPPTHQSFKSHGHEMQLLQVMTLSMSINITVVSSSWIVICMDITATRI